MTDRPSPKTENLLRRLRRMRILVIHPEDAERDIFLTHLTRIGCQVESAWPAPDSLPEGVDIVVFLVDQLISKSDISWMGTSDSIARVGVISFETPEILYELERLNVHGVISKPIRIFGILAALAAAIGISRHENRLKQRIKSLDETLKARRKIEQAVSILSVSRGISEEEAYKRLRDRSMTTNEPIAAIACAIIAASEI